MQVKRPKQHGPGRSLSADTALSLSLLHKHPSAAHWEQVLRQTAPQYSPTSISQTKLSSKISISPNSEQGIIKALTQTPANPGITVHTESTELCEKVSARFPLSCSCYGLIQSTGQKCKREITGTAMSSWKKDAQNVCSVKASSYVI